ncbi:MAG TPA: hypothetical protein VHD56_13235 [Tepidisphaeraceae bacterium]|nr:hypothetical protein [Tepidisphaeraceae bacterium]
MRSKRKFLMLAGSAVIGTSPLLASAAAIWTGNVSTFWSIDGNWDQTGFPGDGLIFDATVNSGTPTVDANRTINNFTLSGGTLRAVPGNALNVTGIFSWNGGTVGADATINATGSLQLANTLQNSGTLIANISSGAISVDSSTVLNNTGTVAVSGSTLTFRAGTSSGRLEAGAGGTILFQGVGPYTLAAGSSLAGNGTFVVAGINLQETVSLANLQLNGTISGGTFTTTGDFDWRSGELKDVGLTTVATTSTLHISTAGVKNLQTRNLTNLGTIDWTGGDIHVQDGAQLQNGNWFKINSDATLDHQLAFSAGSIFNAGTLAKQSGTGTSTIGVPINNFGTVIASTGTLKFTGGGGGGGTWSVASGATLTFAGAIDTPYTFNSSAALTNLGSVNVAGYLKAKPTFISGNNLVLGSIDGAELYIDTGNVPISDFTWNSGVISGPGTSAMAGKTFSTPWGVAGGRTLENSGIMNWAIGAAWGFGGDLSAFDNVSAGTVSNLGGGQFHFQADGVMGLSFAPERLVVQNAGTVGIDNTKSVTIYGTVNNSGTVTVGDAATLTLAAGSTSGGTFLIGDGGKLIATGNATHTFSSSALIKKTDDSSGAHTAILDAATTNFSGTVASTVDLQAGNGDNFTDTLNFLSGSQINANSLTVVTGTVNVLNGSTINTPLMALNGGFTDMNAGASVSATTTTLGTNSIPLATLRINSGATVQAGDFTLNPTGILRLNGGSLTITGTAQDSGTVVGSGTIAGSLNSTGGAFSPGQNPGDIGLLDVTGFLTLDSSSLLFIDIDANTKTNDAIHVLSIADPGDAFLSVFVTGDFSQITPADEFVILTSPTISGAFTIDFPDDGLVNAYDLETNDLVGQFYVDYRFESGQVVLTLVPEPHMIGFLPALLALRRRRR